MALLVAAEALILQLVSVLYQANLLGQLALLAPLLLLGTVGFAGVGTLFAAMLVRARTRDVLLPILLFASVVGSLVGVFILYRQRKGLDTKIPFGPYLAAAGWLFLMVGHQAVERYLGLFPHSR